jgi:signal transduction histidine kinase
VVSLIRGGSEPRQYRVVAVHERALLEERLRLEEKRGHTAALAERSRIAREIHDVLARSLGGPGLQLDAIDALVEAGRQTLTHCRTAKSHVNAIFAKLTARDRPGPPRPRAGHRPYPRRRLTF